MERDYWRWIIWALKRLPRRRPRGGVYDNRVVLAVLLWAALHDRPIDWACRRSSWPMQAWRRRLPDQSTMSRRLRDPRVIDELTWLVMILQRSRGPVCGPLILDGKPLGVSVFTNDPEAANGWGAGTHAKGYKLHALVDRLQRVLAFQIHPMNHAECTSARELVANAQRAGLIPPDTTVLADASYDSNPLYQAVAEAGTRLIAPRRRAHGGICANRDHHPHRLEAIHFTEHDPRWPDLYKRVRSTVERYFGSLSNFGGGLFALPPWVRRLHRVRVWVAAKLALNAARQTFRHAAVA
jgi:hypothetical protein